MVMQRRSQKVRAKARKSSACRARVVRCARRARSFLPARQFAYHGSHSSTQRFAFKSLYLLHKSLHSLQKFVRCKSARSPQKHLPLLHAFVPVALPTLLLFVLYFVLFTVHLCVYLLHQKFARTCTFTPLRLVVAVWLYLADRLVPLPLCCIFVYVIYCTSSIFTAVLLYLPLVYPVHCTFHAHSHSTHGCTPVLMVLIQLFKSFKSFNS